MRTLPRIAAAVVAIGLGTVEGGYSAPAGGTAPQNFTPLTHRAFGECYGGYTSGFGWCWGYDYKPACPAGYRYTCWEDDHGYRHCGCVLSR